MQANLSYSNFTFSNAADGQLYKSSGHSLTANISSYSGPIGFYAELKYQYSEDNFSIFSSSISRGYDAYLSGWYKQRYLPDLLLEGGFGRYEYDSLVSPSDNTTYWYGSLGFDISKYIWHPIETKSEVSSKQLTAKVFYRYLSYTDHSIGPTPICSQSVGLMFRTGL